MSKGVGLGLQKVKKIAMLTAMLLAIVLIAGTLTACKGNFKNFKVTFEVDGAVYETFSTKGNEMITMPKDPVKEGYTFDGWFQDKDIWELPFRANSLIETKLEENMTVYAKWVPIHTTHSGEWKTMKAATCADGMEKMVCDTCKYEETRVLFATKDHQFEGDACTVCQSAKPTEGLSYDLINDGTAYELKMSFDFEPTSTQVVIANRYEGKPVTSIGVNALFDCTSLTSIEIPSSVISIGEGAFWDCTSLTSITIPASVKSIGRFAFDGCKGLKSVYITDIVTWCKMDFANVQTTPLAYADELYLNDKLVTDLVIPEGVTKIGKLAFYNYAGLKSITMPSTLTSIGYGALEGCTGLTSVVIPKGVTVIDGFAFANCTGLKNMEIPVSVKNIEARAFLSCTGLTNVTIGHGVTNIGKFAFADCTGLTSVTMGNGVTKIGIGAFDGCIGLTSITIPRSVTSIGYQAFNGCTGLSKVTIGTGVTSIGDGAFLGCTWLTNIEIPSSVTIISDSAFEGCTNLTSVTIPNSVTAIGTSAFRGCTSLTSMIIPSNVTKISVYAFSECANLETITMPSSVKTISIYAFRGCKKLENIAYSGTKAQWDEISKANDWDKDSGAYKVKCKDGELDKVPA